jgi:hypothetical protein
LLKRFVWVLLFTPAFCQGQSISNAAQSPSSKTQEAYSYETVRYRICKEVFLTGYRSFQVQKAASEVTHIQPEPDKEIKPLLKVSGNIEYDFYYQSYVDTPFAQRKFQQHTVRASLDLLVKDKYPFRISFSNQISNGLYSKNWLSTNLQLNTDLLLNREKSKLFNRLESLKMQEADLKAYQMTLDSALARLNKLKSEINKTDVIQQLIEEREHRSFTPGKGNINREIPEPFFLKGKKKGYLLPLSDSVARPEKGSSFIERQKKELDSISNRVTKLRNQTDSIRTSVEKKYYLIYKKIYQAQSLNDVQKINAEYGIGEKMSYAERLVSNIKTLGIGRTVLNYSELTAWNIPLKGINIEYSSKFYAAFAAGKVDLGLENYFFNKIINTNQSILVGRLGFGNMQHRAVILSTFTGQKNNIAHALVDSVANTIKVAGYAIEGLLRKDEATYLSAEVAKSVKPLMGSPVQEKKTGLWDYNDRSNEGIIIKGQAKLPYTNALISGFYKRLGNNYQSFNLFSYNTEQESWMIKGYQQFFNNRTSLLVTIKQNDFQNPFSEKTVKTNTVFKAFQLTANFPRYPQLSIQYYPGSQVYLINQNKLQENFYYIFNGSLTYASKIYGFKNISTLSYNRYSSKGTDSGFVVYNGINILASQSLFIKRLQLNATYTYTALEDMNYSTLGCGLDYMLSRKFKLNSALSLNRMGLQESEFGERLAVSADFQWLGVFQMQFERSYLPTIKHSFFPVETGRLTWIKTF